MFLISIGNIHTIRVKVYTLTLLHTSLLEEDREAGAVVMAWTRDTPALRGQGLAESVAPDPPMAPEEDEEETAPSAPEADPDPPTTT